jgi:MycE methyltransferase N-terminal
MASGTTAELILAAGGRDGDVARVIESAGPGLIARMVIDEIAYRFDHPTKQGEETTIQVCLKYGKSETEWLLRIDSESIDHEQGHVETPDARIEQNLTEAVRAVFGPGEANATRTVDLRGSDTLEAFKQPPAWFGVTQRVLATMDSRDATNLTELAGRYGSDKWGIHSYTAHYERHFHPLRTRPLTLLEIGVGGLGFDDPAAGGASLRMWKHYFPRAEIFGIDVVDKRMLSQQRLTVLQADQSNPDDLARVIEATGPLDIVVDDGSHRSEDVLTSFHTLFPHLNDGGLYVVEDLQTAYWPRFGGTSEDLDDPTTSTGFLKTLVDGLNHAEILQDKRRPTDYDLSVRAIHFYHNIVFIEKGRNAEPGGPDWVRYSGR